MAIIDEKIDRNSPGEAEQAALRSDLVQLWSALQHRGRAPWIPNISTSSRRAHDEASSTLTPLASPGRRASLWLTCAIAYVVVVVVQTWIRHGAIGATAELPYLVEQLTVAVVGVAAAVAAFASVIPGYRAPGARAVVLVSATVMIAALGWGAVWDIGTVGTLGLGREMDWPCVVSISLSSGALWALAVAMLRRGAPLTPISTSVMSAVAALSLANLEACISRPHVFTATVIVWHGLTAIVLLGAFAGTGRRIFDGEADRRPVLTARAERANCGSSLQVGPDHVLQVARRHERDVTDLKLALVAVTVTRAPETDH